MTEPLYELDEGEPDARATRCSSCASRAGSTPASGRPAQSAALLGAAESRALATFDTDELLDHRSRRPALRIDAA